MPKPAKHRHRLSSAGTAATSPRETTSEHSASTLNKVACGNSAISPNFPDRY